jgi:hypothetical protein
MSLELQNAATTRALWRSQGPHARSFPPEYAAGYFNFIKVLLTLPRPGPTTGQTDPRVRPMSSHSLECGRKMPVSVARTGCCCKPRTSQHSGKAAMDKLAGFTDECDGRTLHREWSSRGTADPSPSE